MSLFKKKDEQSAAQTETTAEAEVKKESRGGGSANLLVIVMSLVFAAISAVMLFVKGIEPVFIVCVVAGVLLIAGVTMIVRYFVKDEYLNLNAYGFSIGVLMIMLSIVAFLRADSIFEAIVIVLGMVLLTLGIIVMQYSLDLKRMSDAIWGLYIVLATLIILCGMLSLLQPGSLDYESYVWWAVMISSAISVIVNVHLMIRLAIFNKREKKNAEAVGNAGDAVADAPDASIPSTGAADETASYESASYESASYESASHEPAAGVTASSDPLDDVLNGDASLTGHESADASSGGAFGGTASYIDDSQTIDETK